MSVCMRHPCTMAWVGVDGSIWHRWMSGVSLHTFTLGKIPPRVFGIKVGLAFSQLCWPLLIISHCDVHSPDSTCSVDHVG